MLVTGHSKPLARSAGQARDKRENDDFHYDDGLNPARGIIVALLLSVGMWLLIWALMFGH